MSKATFLVLVITGIFLFSTISFDSEAQNNPADSSELLLRLTAKYTGSIGWSDVYKCNVDEVIKGNMTDSVIILYITVNNYDEIFFRKAVQEGKKAVKTEFRLLAGFKEIENDKPYVNFKNAFIDRNNRTWEITFMKSEDDE